MGATDETYATPVHGVTVPGFKMGRTEVTVCQYQACVTAGMCTVAQGSQSGDDHPVVWVDWNQSKAFCGWAGGRLCSESEWEYAARNGSAGNLYPWGISGPTCDDAVWWGTGCSPSGPAAGCSKPTGNDKWGVCDLAGNVLEWVEDDWHDSYQGAPTNGSAWVDSPRGYYRVNRGGGFGSYDAGLRASNRDFAHPSFSADSNRGARCCKTP